MMRKRMVAGVIAAVATAACTEARGQSGPSTQRSYDVGQFNRIEVAGPYKVDVVTGAAPSVRASGSEQAIERMIVEVRGDTLRIRPRRERGLRLGWRRSGAVTVAVTVPTLAAAKIAGSGDIAVDRVMGESFEGGIAGSGDLRLGSIEVRRLTMGIAGSGDIRAQAGRAARAEYEIAGSGDIDAGSIVTETAAVSIAGSGRVNANATGTASVDITGSGNVRIRGGASCRVSKTGSGNVECS